MFTEKEKLNELSERVIGAAIEVHRELGPGLLESTYEAALEHELGLMGLKTVRQLSLPIRYKNIKMPLPQNLWVELASERCVAARSS
jgi:GxxExxY protein